MIQLANKHVQPNKLKKSSFPGHNADAH